MLSRSRARLSSITIIPSQTPIFRRFHQSHLLSSSSAAPKLSITSPLQSQFKSIKPKPFSTMSSSSSHNYTKVNGMTFMNLSADGIKALCDEIISKSIAVNDSVAAVAPENRNFSTVVLPLALDEAFASTEESNVTFPSYISTDKSIREVSSECNSKLQKHSIEQGMREDLYKALLDARAFHSASADRKLKEDEQRVMDRMIRDFERNGLALPAEQKEKVKQLKQRLSDVGIQFEQHTAEDTTHVFFTKEELVGLPEDFIARLETKEEDGTKKYKVTMRYPDIIPALKKAQLEETRRKLEFANSARLQDVNTPLLAEALKLRAEIAAMLGYKSHGHYILEVRMAKTPELVSSFISSLCDKLVPPAQQELARLSDLKKKERELHPERFVNPTDTDNSIKAWDFQYYHTQLLEREYAVDEERTKVYFPLEKVLSGVMSIYERVLSLKFEEIPQGQFDTWHADTKLLNVYQQQADGQQTFIGQIYLDVIAREGKFSHAAAWGLRPGHMNKEGEWVFPVACCVANFSKGLMKHNEVVTMLHEFGHLIHNIVSKSRFARFAGTSVERDFVETPSQCMENWCWEKESLALLSGHHETGAALPDEELNPMIAAKNVNSGLLHLRQAFFALFDQHIHSLPLQEADKPIDLAAIWSEYRQRITLVPNTPGTNGAATFGHMFGYDSQYYGYLYSNVFAADIFETFKASRSGGIFDKDLGNKYRQTILEQGGSVDADVMLRTFLGREPDQRSFLKSIGLVASSSS